MIDIAKAGSFRLGSRTVTRLGYGAMQLAGPGVFGPPKDRKAAVAVLREAIAAGVNHIDTSDYYGPYVTNQIIREALHPYPDNLTIVTKVGAFRGDDASWVPAQTPAELARGVHDNLRNLGVDVIDVVNMRILGHGEHGHTEGSIAERFTALAELQRQGLIRHLGLSNVTAAQVAEAQGIAPVVCVQNQYNLVQRGDDALVDTLSGQQIALCRSVGRFQPTNPKRFRHFQAARRLAVGARGCYGRPLLIPGTSSVEHLRRIWRPPNCAVSRCDG